MVLVDNVPTETSEAVLMTPGKIQSIIQEANLTHFEGRPVEVVIIDHLGILDIGEGAPRGTRESESAAPGWIMKELFKVCKATRVFMLVLQQLPKQVPPGVPFSFDAGWGGSAQTNFCDYIIQIWRPEQAEDLADEDRSQVEGQYKIALGKNRYGPSALGHYFFDKTTLRILPPLRVAQPRADELGGDEDELCSLRPVKAARMLPGRRRSQTRDLPLPDWQPWTPPPQPRCRATPTPSWQPWVLSKIRTVTCMKMIRSDPLMRKVCSTSTDNK